MKLNFNKDNMGKFGLGIGILCSLLAIFVGFEYFSIMESTEDCETEIGNLLSWEYALGYTDYEIENYGAPDKEISVEQDNDVFKMFTLSQSHTVEQLQEAFPEGESYIFTLCNGTLRGISKNDWANRNFYHKFRQTV